MANVKTENIKWQGCEIIGTLVESSALENGRTTLEDRLTVSCKVYVYQISYNSAGPLLGLYLIKILIQKYL